MKLGTATAVLIVAMCLALLCAIGHTATYVISPNGACTVTPRGELGMGDKSLVVCQHVSPDETGDGISEVAQTVLVLGPSGGVICDRSHVNILDPTKARGNLVRWYPAC